MDTSGFAFPKPRHEKKRRRHVRRVNTERRERRRRNEPHPPFKYGKTVVIVINDEYRRQVCEGGCVLGRRAHDAYRVGRAMLMREPTRCSGRLHPHHPRYKGQGANIKTPDDEVFCVCAAHHREIHKGDGSFSVIGELPEDFQREMSGATQARFMSHGARRTG